MLIHVSVITENPHRCCQSRESLIYQNDECKWFHEISLLFWVVKFTCPVKPNPLQHSSKNPTNLILSSLPVVLFSWVFIHMCLNFSLIFKQIAQALSFSTVTIWPLSEVFCVQAKQILTWSARLHSGTITETKSLTPDISRYFNCSIKVIFLDCLDNRSSPHQIHIYAIC